MIYVHTLACTHTYIYMYVVPRMYRLYKICSSIWPPENDLRMHFHTYIYSFLVTEYRLQAYVYKIFDKDKDFIYCTAHIQQFVTTNKVCMQLVSNYLISIQYYMHESKIMSQTLATLHSFHTCTRTRLEPLSTLNSSFKSNNSYIETMLG